MLQSIISNFRAPRASTWHGPAYLTAQQVEALRDAYHLTWFRSTHLPLPNQVSPVPTNLPAKPAAAASARYSFT